jgi:ubiquinol-cytochrome c reductase cytochrome c1 subunit
MKKVLFLLTILVAPAMGFASAGGGNLDHVEVSLKDKLSLQNGAKLFVNYCVSCHSANYMRYNRMAADLEIPEDLVVDQMILNGGKIGDPMTTTMSKEDGEAWFGVAPPDLSLIGKLRDPNWLYSYLRGFYPDASTASGWNNKVFPNVAMPHALAGLQGFQKPVYKTETDDHGVEHTTIDSFELISEGSMTVEEFDGAMKDLTNFLYYMGEPARMVRIGWGIWTLLFLFVFGVMAYMLKKEYWRDVH